MNALSFASSYTELRRLHEAVLTSEQPAYDLDGFVQYIFDNADFNIATLTGHGTFHSLGGLVCTTPYKSAPTPALKRCLNLSKVENKSFATVMIRKYTKRAKISLSAIKAELLNLQYKEFQKNKRHFIARNIDLLWLSSFGKKLSSPVPSWSGFMQLTKGESSKTKIQILPFINLNPSDISTIYTALSFAQKECEKYNIKFAPVTFDQPLYIKIERWYFVASYV